MKRFFPVLLTILICLSSCGGNSSSYQLDLSGDTIDINGLALEHGDLTSVTSSGGNCVVVKAKIKPSYDNEATINQNYHNICHLILDHGFDSCSEIQYWAVADMSNGSEEKVISFSVGQDLIGKIKSKAVVAAELGSYVSDLYIHQSLE